MHTFLFPKSCLSNLFFHIYILMMTVNKRFQKKMRRLAMDIEQMLQNLTLLCRFGFFFSPYYVVLTTEAWPFIKWDYSSSNWHELQTTKAQTHDSASCLKEQSCLPLGGHRCVFFPLEVVSSCIIMYTFFFAKKSVYMIMHNHVYTNTVKFKIVSQKLLYVPQYLQSIIPLYLVFICYIIV